MQQIDYDQSLYKQYASGREFCGDTGALWMRTIARHVPQVRNLRVVDLGAGTGRFSPPLAEAFHARVIAVDPSQKMLDEARRVNWHDRVQYTLGSAERLPIQPEAVDVVFASMVVHHFRDSPQAAAELHRVLCPGGVLLIRNSFAGRLDSVRYYEFFPEARAIDEARLPTLSATRQPFAAAGFEFLAHETVDQLIDWNLCDHFARIQKRAISTLEYLTPAQIAAGMERMARAASFASPDEPIREMIDLLVLRRL